jgi:hypothetical protein
MPTSDCLAVSTAATLLWCQGTLRPSSGVMVLWMSALVSRLIMRFMTWLTVASRPSLSM